MASRGVLLRWVKPVLAFSSLYLRGRKKFKSALSTGARVSALNVNNWPSMNYELNNFAFVDMIMICSLTEAVTAMFGSVISEIHLC